MKSTILISGSEPWWRESPSTRDHRSVSDINPFDEGFRQHTFQSLLPSCMDGWFGAVVFMSRLPEASAAAWLLFGWLVRIIGSRYRSRTPRRRER